MICWKKVFPLVLAMTLFLAALPLASAEGAGKKVDLFSNPQINAMIDENYEQVLEQGWAELRIPQSLHGITEDMLSPNALDVARRLIDAGYEARIIGGAMRDIVMGTVTMDFDIVTNATIEQQLELMDDMTFHSVQTGLTFGYVHYPDEIIDLAQCLNIPAAYYGMEGVPDFDPEALYSDNFIFDSFQRDLSINAICYDAATGDLVDYHGGLHDIREGVMNTIAEPETEFTSNPPAFIRALRFKSRYGYAFSDHVEAVLRQKGEELLLLNTPETIRHQLLKFWPAGYARACYDTLAEYSLLDTLYPPLSGLGASDFMAAAVDWMDEWNKAGNLQSDDLAMGVFLWPAVAGAEDIAARSAEVFALENQVCEIDGDLAAHYTAMYALQSRLEQGESEDAEAILADPAFDDAFELLLIRARIEEGLDAAVEYWTNARQTAL
ncbi:MAG: hypothetical protein IJI53_14545 [Clostridia bacterium]|nr:hypothetical protein [Clostridia bacterium]MBR0409242.1 hypothetical protein [Clostridia bacterium]